MKTIVLTTEKCPTILKSLNNYCQHNNAQLFKLEDIKKEDLALYLPNTEKFDLTHFLGETILVIENSNYLRSPVIEGDTIFDLGVSYSPDGTVKDSPVIAETLGDTYHMSLEKFNELKERFDEKSLILTHKLCPETNQILSFFVDIETTSIIPRGDNNK